jgi:hypothetical protein
LLVLKPLLEESGAGLPLSFSLYQNSPNPFNPATQIRYSVPALRAGSGEGAGLVTLKVYDLLGRELATLVNETKQPGVYETVWNASNIPTGVYIYRLTAGSRSAVRKMILVR